MIYLLSKILAVVMNGLNILTRLEKHILEIKNVQAIQDQKLDVLDQKQDKILTAVTPLPAVGFRFISDLEGQITEGATSTTMTNSQKLTLTVQAVDKKGQPAQLDGIPAWAIDDATLAEITPGADGLTCDVVASGPLGTGRVSVSGDADLGEGTQTIFGEYALTVTQGSAVGFKITASEPVEQ